MFHRKKGAALLCAALLTLSPLSPALALEAIEQATPIDKEAFDNLISSGKIAPQEDLQGSTWASAIQGAGILRVGGTQTSFLFSQLDPADENIRGFDAGLFKLLTRYLLGDESAYELTLVDSNTREAVLQNDQADVVIATYSITEERAKRISFAGPYYTSRQAVLTQARNTTIQE